MNTFPIVKRKDIAAHGTYGTQETILRIYDALAEAQCSGQPYQTLLNPPPANPRCCHPPKGLPAVMNGTPTHLDPDFRFLTYGDKGSRARRIREVLGTGNGFMAAERADRAVFIASDIYTEEALGFAQGKPIELVDGAQLAQMFRHVQAALKSSVQAATAVATPVAQATPETPARPYCPRCGSDMVLRRARTGPNAGREFWGCPAFPKCRGVVEVE